jgi:uncharacterized membrane protein
MNLGKRLAAWEGAGVIDAETRSRIERFEEGRLRPVLLYALGGLGALTVGIGLISVVAANWDHIGKVAKLGADLSLGVGLGAGLYVAASRRREWLTDVLAGIYYAFVLASLALVGQLYQLGTPTYQALLVWSLTTLPFMTLVRGRLLGLVWLAGLVCTNAFCIAAGLDWLDHRPGADLRNFIDAAMSAVSISALGFFAAARIGWLAHERPHVSDAWASVLVGALSLAAFLSCFVFYVDFAPSECLHHGVVFAGVALFGVERLLPRLFPHASSRARFAMRACLALFFLVLVTGTTVLHDSMPAVGGLLQLAMLGLAAWTTLEQGYVRAFNAVTLAIAIRILVIYFEVFGSMLDTGLGMITGGLLTLLLAWVWKKKSPVVATRFAADRSS